MARIKNKEEMVLCPVGSFLRDIEKSFGRKSKFVDHLTRSRIEILKGIRALVDERIETLDNKKSGKSRKKATKIKVD
ncbi:hypothetical protein D1BOALGB6SA_6696 [Olavius sp. associated proteobacterium Delta 1]|nr:hypothetical protein D1BOALGB6SA_6696 [Olavius sp. associated proteobacterium Delta 1]